MDDEDDRRLLDIIGDVDLLNDYLHGSNSKSIGEDDVTNAAYGSDGAFFVGNTAGSDAALKDGSSTMGEFGEDSAGAGLQLSSSLSFIEDELGTGGSPEGVDLGGEDQPFDILQKSLMEADITEQTLEQEAMLDSQPAAPTPVQPPPVSLASQLVSGGYGGGVGVVTSATAAFPTGQFIQGVSQLPNGSSQHIQVLSSFGGGTGVMTLSSLERTPQIVFRPGGPLTSATGTAAGAQVFAPTQGQVGLPLKNIPLQNFIIQRGPGGTQTLVRHIQPKPPHGGAQTVYSLGIQPTSTTIANVANANTASPAGHYTANGSIVVHSPLGQQQTQAQTNLQPGQFLLPSSLALAPAPTIQNGPADPNSNTLITNQNTVQIVAGQNFTATPGGQLIVNQGVVGGGQVAGAVTQTWTSFASANPTSVQTSSTSGRLTLVGPATAGAGGRGQTSSGHHVQRLLVTQTQNCTALSPLPGSATQEQQEYRQDSPSPAGSRQAQLVNQHGNTAVNTMTDSTLNAQVSTLKRPALPQLTRGGMILQQLRKDHTGVESPDRRRFTSFDDALLRLLPYHVFQGAPPSADEFSQVDEEFEAVATQVLKRTQAMVNKYRRLLIVEAERSSPSSEMVMIDRTFNQEERNNLTQDRRMVLVDPDGFQEDFCCGVKHRPAPEPLPSQPLSGSGWRQTDMDSTEPPYRTDPQPGYGDPGGGGGEAEGGGGGGADGLQPPLLDSKSMLDLKRSQQQGYGSNNSGYPHHHHHHGNLSPSAQPHYPPELDSPPPPDTDSVLEAAVNSILEC